MAIVADGSAAWLHSFVVGHIEPGARVITGAWRGHNGRQDPGYARERRNQRAARAARERPLRCCPPCVGSRRWPDGGC